MVLPLLLALSWGCGTAAVPAPPLPDLVDPRTRTRFPAERSLPGQEATRLRAVGLGSREVLQVDEYCLAVYVDLQALRPLAGAQRDPFALAKLLCSGKVPLSFPRRFLKGVGRRFRGKALLTSLAKFWPAPGFDPGSPSVQALLVAVDQDVARGDWVEFACDGQGTLLYQVNGGPVLRIKDPLLCQALIFNYLGDDGDLGARALIGSLLKDLPAQLEQPSGPR